MVNGRGVSRDRCEATNAAGSLVRAAGSFGRGFQFRDMFDKLLKRRPAHEIQANHLVTSQGWLPPCPQTDQQTNDDRTVGLDLDSLLVRTEQMAATQHVLEKPEEKLNCPPMLINVSYDLSGYVEKVCSDPEHAVAGGTTRASLTATALGVRLAFHQNHAHSMIGPSVALAGRTEVHNEVAENPRRRGRR